jgi:hypothetical protein
MHSKTNDRHNTFPYKEPLENKSLRQPATTKGLRTTQFYPQFGSVLPIAYIYEELRIKALKVMQQLND